MKIEKNDHYEIAPTLLTVPFGMNSQMKNKECKEGEHVLRAKIHMSSPNINMRDPTLYRIKHESHQETGDKWCIYPMYDFSHPISDALEGITHSLCTLEFEDHRPFYDWTIEKLLPTGLITARPRQIEFSRLNIQSTVLSKRKLIQLVEQEHVNGWDDPRMPTLSGMRRRGVPPAALRLFCERVGISKTDSNIAYSALEDCIRLEMDESTPRAFCVLKPLKVTLTNWDDGNIENFEVSRHPKLDHMGTRVIPFGQEIYIERSDFYDLDGPEGRANNGKIPMGYKRLLLGKMVRLRYAYVIQCDEVVRDPETQDPIELKCSYLPDTRAGNKTQAGMSPVNGIIHWVEGSNAVQCTVNLYDRLFQVEEPGKESGDYLKDLNPTSLEVLHGVLVESSVAMDVEKHLKKTEQNSSLYPSSLAYQFERSGYFALDKATKDKSKLVLNRVVTLRDTWDVRLNQERNARNRGRGASKESSSPSTAPSGPKADALRVAFRAATIVQVGPHPEAVNLLVCQVDCGDVADDGSPEFRTVVAGLAGKISTETMVGKKVVAVTNLKPARMRGIESAAMLLAASDSEDNVELINVPEGVANGELLSLEGMGPSEPDVMMKSKGALKAFERVIESLKVNNKGEAIWVDERGQPHRLETSAGSVCTESLKDVVIQ